MQFLSKNKSIGVVDTNHANGTLTGSTGRKLKSWHLFPFVTVNIWTFRLAQVIFPGVNQDFSNRQAKFDPVFNLHFKNLGTYQITKMMTLAWLCRFKYHDHSHLCTRHHILKTIKWRQIVWYITITFHLRYDTFYYMTDIFCHVKVGIVAANHIFMDIKTKRSIRVFYMKLRRWQSRYYIVSSDLTHVLLNCVILFFSHSKLELITQFPASIDEK